VDSSLRDLPVIVLADQAVPINVLKGMSAGADRFLSKACEPNEIIRCVNAALDRGASCKTFEKVLSFLDCDFRIVAGRDQLLDILLLAFEDLINANQRYDAEIFQRRKTDAKLKAVGAAQATNQANGEFLANMSHEIRTYEWHLHCVKCASSDHSTKQAIPSVRLRC